MAASHSLRLPALGFTHYQPAQPVTMGRRIANWAADLSLLRSRVIAGPGVRHGAFKGLRGATGTQASYLELFDGDHDKVDELEERVLKALLGPTLVKGQACKPPTKEQLAMRKALQEGVAASDAAIRHSLAQSGLSESSIADRERRMSGISREPTRSMSHHMTVPLVGQTYPRVIDTYVLSDLGASASVLHKIATDIRLLCNRKELDEPFEDKQIGSSAMPYKRNPMRCERICGLARFVMNLVGNAYDTAATQWLERTLDDSSNRRLSLPEAFLALDGALDLMHNVASGLIVHEAMVRKNLMAELPFMATENILMACVKLGGDRQHYHELIRQHAQAAGMRVKQEGLDNDLLDRLKADKNFQSKARGGVLSAELDWEGVMDPMKYIGRSVEQTERFIKDVVEPLREQYGEAIAKLEDSGPKV
ncbi:MAG: hypothetical protein KF869_00940 [Phycisphaeraceae bacterium]|nr:hypothetical protein [Phycisphaeraceae bacterium]